MAKTKFPFKTVNNYSKFFQVFEKVKRSMGFKFDDYTTLRSKDELYCPITAVCKYLTNKEYAVCSFNDAAKEIGLPKDLAENIVTYADLGNCCSRRCKKYFKNLGL